MFLDLQGQNLRGTLWPHIITHIGSKAPGTQKAYAHDIKLWLEWLEESVNEIEHPRSKFLNATATHGNAFKTWLLSRPGVSPKKSEIRDVQVKGPRGKGFYASNATVARVIASLRGTYDYLIAMQVVERNPFHKMLVKSPRVGVNRKRENIRIGDDKVKEILALPNKDSMKGLRDLTLLTIMFATGARRQEICNLTMADIRRDTRANPYIYFRAPKSGRDRRTRLAKWAAKVVDDWCSERLRQGARQEDPFLISFYGSRGGRILIPLTPDALYKIFARYCMVVGVKANPHCARVTVVNNLLDKGISKEKVAEVTGHSSIKMVEVYERRDHELTDSASAMVAY